ncbi:hypothetical protein LCGC14_1166460 [marine sediment metagenome]|uniref:Two component regulator three Y domain-containing protein n=1 Tax=marine sediment metagenome TaxID=412755 RepID=A0A0F9LVZ8_9ZZZZ
MSECFSKIKSSRLTLVLFFYLLVISLAYLAFPTTSLAKAHVYIAERNSRVQKFMTHRRILETGPTTFAIRSSAWRANIERADYYKSLYMEQKAKANITGNRRLKKIFLSLANKYYRRYRNCLKQIADAPLFWKVTDNTDSVYVKIKVKKRTYSKSRAIRKQHYWDLYKLVKAKALRTNNPTQRRRYLNQAKIYKRRSSSIKSTYYRHVKTVDYGWTAVNLVRAYIWRTSAPGIYKFYVFAKDRDGNSQRNVASNYLIVR